MSIQRYSMWQRHDGDETYGVMKPDQTGGYVTYADHVAEADDEYDRGISDERARIYRELKEIEGQLHWQDAIAFVKIVELG